ncbi:TSUP family transporter [Arcanobacterium hippocoleae]
MLIFALGFQMREAAATSLVVMIIAAISGLLARLGTAVVFDWFVIIPFVFASMLGGMLGAVFNDRFRSSTLTALFSLLLAGVAAFVLAQNIPLLITPLA